MNITEKDKNYKMISVACPTYNRFKFTTECFEQILHDERVSEIIVSDDCSNDGSYDKLCDFYKYEPKVKIYRNETNIGCAFNKRKAIELATNSYVIIFDSDNVIDRTYLDVVFNYSWDEDVILQPEYLMPNFDFRNYSGLLLNKSNIAEWIDKPLLETALNAHNFFCNRDAYLKNTENQEDAITSDSILFAYNWLASGRSIFITPNLWYWHTVHQQSHYQTQNHLTPIGLHQEILNKLKQMS